MAIVEILLLTLSVSVQLKCYQDTGNDIYQSRMKHQSAKSKGYEEFVSFTFLEFIIGSTTRHAKLYGQVTIGLFLNLLMNHLEY